MPLEVARGFNDGNLNCDGGHHSERFLVNNSSYLYRVYRIVVLRVRDLKFLEKKEDLLYSIVLFSQNPDVN